MTGQETQAKSQSRNGIQVISRAADILRVLRDDPTGLSLGQIADRVGLARSTVQRIVSALQDERMIIMLGNGGFRLGPEVTSLAKAAHFDTVEVCRPCLLELSQVTGETTDLSVLRGGQIIFLDQVPGSHRLRTVSSVGDVFPLTNTANGKAALALLTEDEAKARAMREWEKAGTSGNWAALSKELEQIRQTGLAFDLGDHTEGISAVGTGFRAPGGEINAISVPVPSSRFDRERDRVEKALRDAVKRVKTLLGQTD
jgi:DNA-binding IclR family transcriptional regulator